MSNIIIETTQNVTIEHKLASIGQRVLSTIIDYFVFFVYIVAMSIMLGLLQIRSATFYFIVYIPVFFYSLLSELIFQGKTVGKMIVKTQVVKLDGSQPTFLNYFSRWIFRILEVHAFYGVIAMVTIIINEKGQRLGDIVGGTTVISLVNKTRLNQTQLMPFPDDYKMYIPQVSLLNAQDIDTVVETLNYLKSNTMKSASYQHVSNMVKEALCKRLNITIHWDTRLFLETILRDYNYYAMTNEQQS